MTLVAGETYYIGALANNVDETSEDAPGFTESALIQFDSARFVEGAVLSRPVDHGGTGPKYFGANMIISALPTAVPTNIVVTPNNINENNAPGRLWEPSQRRVRTLGHRTRFPLSPVRAARTTHR